MYDAIHLQNGRFLCQTADYIPKHDLIYRTPPTKGYDGLPIGSGRFGGMLYHSPRSIELSLHHTDAIDFAPDGNFKAWAWEAEEKNTAPYSLGQLRITAPVPMFDWVYLEAFEERLNLAEACVEGHAKTSFSKLNYRIFAPSGKDTVVIEIEATFAEAAPLTIQAEKWATPNFFHHYEQIVRLHDKGLHQTACRIDGDALLLSHYARGTAACVALRAAGESSDIVRNHAHGGELRFAPSTYHQFTLYIASAVVEAQGAEASESAASEAASRLLQSIAGQPTLFAEHCAAWRTFWNASMVHIEQDYLENLYYIHLYQLNSCARGKYPPLFGGLWTWFGDSRNWGHFYHWNHQQTNWGLYASGHPELVENYLSYRFAMLEAARADGQTLFQSGGVFYSDISNMNGYNALEPDTSRNFGVSVQIALDFYRHWQFTRDERFLKDKAAPMLRSVLRLLLDVLQQDADGYFRIRGGATAYESYWNLKETFPDWVHIRALIGAVLEAEQALALTETEATLCRDILAHLYPCPTQTVEHDGQALTIFADGRKWNGEIVAYGEGEYPLSPFPATLMSAVWPTRLIGLADRGAEMFDIARNTARVLFDREVYQPGALGCSGHAPSPQLAACLGMPEDANAILALFAKTYQIFPNGLMHFADLSRDQQWSAYDRPRVLDPAVQQTQWTQLHEKSTGLRTKLPSEWFLHCYFEAAANLFCGIQQLLLQSADGIIRVFPALLPAQSAAFDLWATGGFRVRAEAVRGEVRLISIESRTGGTCRIENPWGAEVVAIRSEKGTESHQSNDGMLTFTAEKDVLYQLFAASRPPEQFYQNPFECAPNRKPKHFEQVQLGLDSIYRTEDIDHE